MKKLYLSIIIAVIMIGYYSCKKDYTAEPFIQEDELTTHSKKVLSLIKSFDEKMKSTFKSSEQIELDSAVWNMEALLNYTYSYPDSSAKDFVVYKSNYTMDIDANGMVAMGDVEVVYNQMEDSLNAQFNQIPCDIKHLRFSDVALDSVAGSTAYLTLANGYGFNLILGMYYPFEEDDDWYWGTLGQNYGDPPLGKCNGTELGVSDGSDELQYRMNNPAEQSVPVIYTDLVTLETTGFEFEDESGNPRLYIGWDYPEDNCLTNDTLTYYLIQMDDIISTSDNEGGLRPPDKSFVSVKIDDYLQLLPENNGRHLHYYNVTYGKPSLIALPD